jgi:hypothetical protein
VVIVPKHEQPAKQVNAKDPTAAKKARGRPKRNTATDGQAAASDSSDDELEIEDEDSPELTPALLTLTPTNERETILYRAVEAVWSPRNRSVDPEKVRAGMANYGDLLRGLRDAWKTKNESLRKAELPNSSTAAEAARLKEEVARYRQLLENVMLKSTQYGHPTIVKRYVSPPMSLCACICPTPSRQRGSSGPGSFADLLLSSDWLCLRSDGTARPQKMKRGHTLGLPLHNSHVHRVNLLDSLRIALFRDLLWPVSEETMASAVNMSFNNAY